MFDVERVCVETNTMPYEDYLECRRFSFLINLFTYSVFFPLKRLIKKDLGVSFFNFVWAIFKELEKKNLNNFKNLKFLKFYFEFSKESEDELFETKQDIYEFYSKDENYQKLLTAELGDNLTRKYAAKMIGEALKEIINFSIELIPNMVEKDKIQESEINIILDSSRKWLTNLFIFDAIFDWEKEKANEVTVNLDYDLPQWFSKEDQSILKFKKKINYKMTLNNRNEHLKNELISLFGKDDRIFTVGKYFHQMQTNYDDIRKSSIKV